MHRLRQLNTSPAIPHGLQTTMLVVALRGRVGGCDGDSVGVVGKLGAEEWEWTGLGMAKLGLSRGEQSLKIAREGGSFVT